MPREFRTQESYIAEKITRDMIAPFLQERGFREIDDQRKKYGQNQAQTIRAIDDTGRQVAMGVRLCWRQRGSKAEEHFAAAQLLAGIEGGDWIGSLNGKMDREKRDGKTHLLVVQRAGNAIVTRRQGNRIKISSSVILKSRQYDEPEKSSGAASLTEKTEIFSDFDAIALDAPSAKFSG